MSIYLVSLIEIFDYSGHITGITNQYPLQDFLNLNMNRRIILNIVFPAIDSSSNVFNSYKVLFFITIEFMKKIVFQFKIL